MHWEIDARQTALDPEEAAKIPAALRDRGMGAAALASMRRDAEAMKKLRISESKTGLIPDAACRQPRRNG